MKELSLAAGKGETFVRDLLEKGTDPRTENLKALAEALGMTLSELYEGDAAMFQKIRIVGHVVGNGGWAAEDRKTSSNAVEFRVDGGEPIAVLVAGNDMFPAYRDGDLLIGARFAGASADNLIGRECIILTEDGQRHIRFLARGFSRGKFNLRSYNPIENDIENVKLKWVAPILWIKRGG